MKHMHLDTSDFAEFGKTDTFMVSLTINKTEAHAIMDDLCNAEESTGGYPLSQASRQMRMMLKDITDAK